MAVSDHTRRKLAVDLGSQVAANDIVGALDSAAASITTDSERRLWHAIGSTEIGVDIVDDWEAHSAHPGSLKSVVFHLFQNAVAADIYTALDQSGVSDQSLGPLVQVLAAEHGE